MGLFDRVDLWINVEKTVGMVRKLYRTEGIHFDGGLYTEDGGVWMYLLGEAQGESTVPVTWGGYGNEFPGGPPSYPVWTGEGTPVGGGPATYG